MEDQAKKASSSIHYAGKICVNRCKSVSKKRLRDTDFIDFTDYDVEISDSSARWYEKLIFHVHL